MKTNLICATFVFLAFIAAIVAGCVVADSAWPLAILLFCDFRFPSCTVVKPTTFVLPEENKEEHKEVLNKEKMKEAEDNKETASENI